MSIFKKTVKYSKASKDLDSKIKSLDEGLKKTGVIPEQNDTGIFFVEEKQEENVPKIVDKVEVIKEEEQLYNWRKTLLAENIEDEILNEYSNETPQLTRVENYISESNKDLIILRDQILKEISQQTLLDLPEIKNKISRVLEIYDELKEGLLNEPPETKNEDPLTPLNQNFVTPEDLNKHYTLFINRIQEQLATLGGGGETKLKYLDDVVGIATNASAYDGKFLKYDHSLGQFVFETVSGGGGGESYWALSTSGIHTTSNVGIGTTNTPYILSVADNTNSTPDLTNVLADFSGNVNSYAQVNIRNAFDGSNASSDLVLTANNGNNTLNYLDLGINNTGFGTDTWTINGPTDGYLYASDGNLSLGVGQSTSYLSLFSGGTLAENEKVRFTNNGVGIGTTNTPAFLNVSGDVIFEGSTNTELLRVTQLGTGPAFLVEHGSRNDANAFVILNSGQIGIGVIAPAEEYVLEVDGGDIRFVEGGQGDVIIRHQNLVSSIFANGTVQLGLGANGSDAIRINLNNNVGIGTINPTSKLTVQGDVKITGVATAYSFRPSSGYYQSANGTNGFYVFDTSGDVSFQGKIVTNYIRSNSNINPTITVSDLDLQFARNVLISGITTSSGGFVGNLTGTASTATTAGYATTAGIATVAQGLTGTPNLSVGIVTASAFVGDGSLLTNLPGGGSSGYANTAGIATYSTSSGIATYATSSGIATYADNAGIATYATSSGIATYADNAGIATYATSSGIATYATSAGIATYATTAGIATVAQGLTGTPNVTVGIITSTISIPTQLKTRSVAEKTTLVSGNTVELAFSTGGGNVAICTSPTGDITLNVTDIPTDSTFDNHSISFSVVINQTGTARTCTAVNLNGVSRTIRWAGGSLANAVSGISTNNGFDIFTFTGINTVGSASTTANYVVLGSVNGGFN